MYGKFIATFANVFPPWVGGMFSCGAEVLNETPLAPVAPV
jgi:hypothetical protein